MLVVDCSSSWCVLALESDNGCQSFTEELGRGHSQRLLEEIERLREGAGIAPSDWRGLGVSVGPGSFTGVRIGVAAVQALAFACDAPVARVDSLHVLAQSAGVTGDEPIVVLRRSRGDQYYAGLYGAGPSQQAVARLGTLALIEHAAAFERWWQDAAGELTDDPRPAGVVGERPAWLPRTVDSAPVAPQADALLLLTKAQHRDGQGVVAEDALPFYLEADSPWQRQRS